MESTLMDWLVFASLSLAAVWHQRKIQKKDSLLIVDKDNQPIRNTDKNDDASKWYRSTFILVMYEPPHMFYEPKEWSHTTVLLLQEEQEEQEEPEGNTILKLPGGKVQHGETYEQSAVRWLQKHHKIDVHSPENCLHHLFAFPMEFDEKNESDFKGVWGDFYECVARGPMPDFVYEDREDHHIPLSSFSLSQLKHMTDLDPNRFSEETLYALKLYFQRQGDLRAKRRLMKGYSSADLENYGLRSNNSLERLVFMDLKDIQRQQAVDYTLKTDDGMAPNLLYQADVVLLGVSRAGKTPLSIFMAQTLGLKVANIPLVMELPPPSQLEKLNPRKIFCLTLQPDYLANFRVSRFRREMKKHVGQRCTYADLSYVKRDVENARALARSKGYTEIDVTGRAMEETSSLIVSKLQERFPELHII